MSNRHSSWMASSLPRSTAANSPSVGRLSDIKGRLSFSAMKTPAFKPKQRSLVEHARTSASPINGYHMSKQNPDVLDRLCSPSPSHRDTLLHKKTLTPATVRIGAGGGVLIGARNSHQSPSQGSLVKQMLNDKHRAPTSLVHLATRGKTFRSSINISPVVVKLSGAATHNLPSNSSSLNSSQEETGGTENGAAETSLRLPNGEGSPGKSRDPCDKNVVLSALRQQRKRWATSPPDEDSDQSPSTSDSPFAGAPLAKRTKHSSQGSEPQSFKYKNPLSYILGDRKRAYTAPSYSMSPDSKKSRLGTEGSCEVVVPLPVRGKVSLSDLECDRESEVSEHSEVGERESGTSSKTSSRAPSECIGGIDGDGVQRRSLTPPVQFDEAEINRKREESLNNLKAVFSPKGADKKSSNRRKLPIFCATGNRPHLPTPLSTTHTVTQEDLKKDREAAAAKLREILTAEDPSQKTELTASLTSLPSQTALSTAALSSKDTLNPLPGVRLSSSLSGSLPSLPSASATTKSGTSLSSAGGSLSLMIPKSSQSQTTSTSSNMPPPAISTSLSSSALPTTSLASISTVTTTPLQMQPSQAKSVSFAPLPVPTPASTTQASFAFPSLLPNSSSQVAPGSQPPATFTLSTATAPPQASSGLPLSTSTTTSTAAAPQLQFVSAPCSTYLGSTTTAASTTLNLNNPLQVGKASMGGGLAQGINFTQQQLTLAANSGPQLGLFQNTSSAASSLPSASVAALAQGGSIFSSTNSTINAPTTSTSGGFTFTLPVITQQQQQVQQSNSPFQTAKPSLSAANSSVTTNSIFSLNSGPAASQPQTSSTGTSGLVFPVQPPQQQQQQQQPNQMSIFGGAQAQSSQNSGGGGGITFNFSQPPANNGSGLATSSSAGLNFTAGTQPPQATGGNGLKSSTFNFSAGLSNNAQQQIASGSSGLNFNAGTNSLQSSGGLSLFNNSGSAQKPQQNQPSIFTAGGGGAANTQQPNQSSSTGGLFSNQQQSTAAGFPGFKFSAGAGNSSQPQQGIQLATNSLSGGNTGGLTFSAGQGRSGVSSSFPSFNSGSQTSDSSSGFNFSAGTANTGGGGLFQNTGSAPGQMSNPLAATGNQTQKSGINFNFSASAMGAPQQTQQQQQQQQQSQMQGQSQGGLFSFGQKSNSSTSGFNFTTNGSTGLGLGKQPQNGNSGFNFSAGMGMNAGGGGGTGSSGGVFNNSSLSNVFQTQAQPSSNVFQTPQPQKQPSFTTPANQPTMPGQGGFNFQTTPSAFSFSAGTPGPGDSGRPVARARRRKK